MAVIEVCLYTFLSQEKGREIVGEIDYSCNEKTSRVFEAIRGTDL
jgi:hypothetical protein